MRTETGLSPLERARYHRQMILPELGEAGQTLLRRARVAIVGLGGLGAPSATYLAAAGIGELALIDHDEIELSNLHRQVLFAERDVGRAKVAVTAERLRAINSAILVEPVATELRRGNAAALLAGYDVVVDCTDNFRTRYAINAVCAAARVPLVQASILQFDAQLAVWCAADGPCYCCLYPEAPPADIAPSCAEAGVIGVLPGILGAYQANEVLKLVLGIGEPLVGKLALVGVLENRFEILTVTRDPDCPVCSGKAGQNGQSDNDDDAVAFGEVDVDELRRLIGAGDALQMIDVREASERLEQGAIAGDIHIALGDVSVRLGELDPGKPTIVYCLSGQRSLAAAQVLADHGFSNVSSLKKGFVAWSAAALRTVA